MQSIEESIAIGACEFGEELASSRMFVQCALEVLRNDRPALRRIRTMQPSAPKRAVRRAIAYSRTVSSIRYRVGPGCRPSQSTRLESTTAPSWASRSEVVSQT